MVLAEVAPLDAGEVPLAEALGRVLAEDVSSDVDVPPFDSSAMDGFAVPAGRRRGAAGRGRVARRAPVRRRRSSRATAIRISTGAVVPEGADAVVPGRAHRARAARSTCGTPERGREHPPRRARTCARARRCCTPGTELGPAELGRAGERRPRRGALRAAAAGGACWPPATSWRRPARRRARADLELEPAHASAAQVARAGGEVVLSETVPDSAEATRAALARALAAADVVCVSGGVSVGPHDHVKGAFAELGVEERFWGVALQPGQADVVRHGRARRSAFGLPGNPVSAMVTFHLFARPALRALQGADPAATRGAAPCSPSRWRATRGATQAVRVPLEHADDGWRATPDRAAGLARAHLDARAPTRSRWSRPARASIAAGRACRDRAAGMRERDPRRCSAPAPGARAREDRGGAAVGRRRRTAA